MVKTERPLFEGTSEKKAPWYDKVNYSTTWVLLIQRASFHRTEGNYRQYIDCIDTLITNLLSEERTPIKKLKDTLLKGVDYGLNERLEAYYIIHEAIVDILEKRGFLSRELTIIASTVSLEPTGDTE